MTGNLHSSDDWNIPKSFHVWHRRNIAIDADYAKMISNVARQQFFALDWRLPKSSQYEAHEYVVLRLEFQQ